MLCVFTVYMSILLLSLLSVNNTTMLMLYLFNLYAAVRKISGHPQLIKCLLAQVKCYLYYWRQTAVSTTPLQRMVCWWRWILSLWGLQFCQQSADSHEQTNVPSSDIRNQESSAPGKLHCNLRHTILRDIPGGGGREGDVRVNKWPSELTSWNELRKGSVIE